LPVPTIPYKNLSLTTSPRLSPTPPLPQQVFPSNL